MELPKHLACDECRSRKLACSKELDGCVRCRKEGIACIYSPQKQMGRPRKRPHPVSDTKKKQIKHQLAPIRLPPEERHRSGASPSVTPTSAPKTLRTENATASAIRTACSPPSASAGGLHPFTPASSFNSIPDENQMDIDWSLLNSTAANMSFLDFIKLDPNQPFDPSLVAPELLSLSYPVEPPKPANQFHFGVGGLFDGLTFSDLSLDANSNKSPPYACNQASPPNSSYSEVSSDNPPALSSAKTPSLLSDSSASDPQGAEKSPTAATSCVCLANMYLALDSLQNLPSNTRDAMCAARYGSRVAHDCIQCPSCSAPMLTEGRLHIQSLQNHMVLGGLLPAIADAYMKIIPMVDNEAQRARAERRKLFFSTNEFGGLWGRMAQEKVCMDNSSGMVGDMDPALWRQIVRSMLKLDVYGMNAGGGSSQEAFRHLGLRDVIDMMEERSLKRHEMMDENPEFRGSAMDSAEHPLMAPGEKPTCLKIIDIAKLAVESIVIP